MEKNKFGKKNSINLVFWWLLTYIYIYTCGHRTFQYKDRLFCITVKYNLQVLILHDVLINFQFQPSIEVRRSQVHW